MRRIQLLIQGQVQGVGFRPYVYRTACLLNLSGWVKNHPQGALIEVQGQQVEAFLPALQSNLPSLAHITHYTEKSLPCDEKTDFQIIQSDTGDSQTRLPPDTAPCNACLQELFDKNSHYQGYPFLNCTQCGPRLSITKALPYDREKTSLAPFTLCPACKHDYLNPQSRRYHAEPTACRNCGPGLSLSISKIASAIKKGEIIALKSTGGYQLLCDAHNEAVITKLRKRKCRPSKPFALLALNLASIQPYARLSEKERSLLLHPSRPIVILKARNAQLPSNIAPGLKQLGFMCPNFAAHVLLFHALLDEPKDKDWQQNAIAPILIATSANASGEPMITDNQAAFISLPGFADRIVSAPQQIQTHLDDSVMHVINHKPFFIRRARGFVPTPIQLTETQPPTLALGGQLKNTFCITRGDEAFVSQPMGDLTQAPSIRAFHDTLTRMLSFLCVKPECIAHDLHPDFYTTQIAKQWKKPTIAVQHHHAHSAAVLAEHGLGSPMLGLALDGYGYGLDGSAWGGELFYLHQAQAKRLAHLKPLPQPGGERAAREPWRMATSVLYEIKQTKRIATQFSAFKQAPHLHSLLTKKINCPLSSSAGRWFDAASALLGVQLTSEYEGHAALRLEQYVTKPEVLSSGFSLESEQLNLLPLMAVLSDLNDPIRGANLFHGTLIAALARWIGHYCQKLNLNQVTLSGGCFMNRILTEGLVQALKEKQITPYLPQALPAHDGGLSLGQAFVAGHAFKSELPCV